MNSVSGLHCRWLLRNEYSLWPPLPLVTHEWILFLASIAPGYSWMNSVSGLHCRWLLRNAYCLWPLLPLVTHEWILSLATIAPGYSWVNTLSGLHCRWLHRCLHCPCLLSYEYSLWTPLPLLTHLWRSALHLAAIAFLLSWPTDFSRHCNVFCFLVPLISHDTVTFSVFLSHWFLTTKESFLSFFFFVFFFFFLYSVLTAVGKQPVFSPLTEFWMSIGPKGKRSCLNSSLWVLRRPSGQVLYTGDQTALVRFLNIYAHTRTKCHSFVISKGKWLCCTFTSPVNLLDWLIYLIYLIGLIDCARLKRCNSCMCLLTPACSDSLCLTDMFMSHCYCRRSGCAYKVEHKFNGDGYTPLTDCATDFVDYTFTLSVVATEYCRSWNEGSF